MANQHPFPDLVLDGGSFCLTTPSGPAGGWQVIEYRDQDAKADTVRFEVLRQLEQDGREVEQVAARDMRSKALANALAGVLNGEMAVTDREQLRQLRDEADEPPADPVATAIHDLADAVRSTGHGPKRQGRSGGILPGPPHPNDIPHHRV